MGLDFRHGKPVSYEASQDERVWDPLWQPRGGGPKGGPSPAEAQSSVTSMADRIQVEYDVLTQLAAEMRRQAETMEGLYRNEGSIAAGVPKAIRRA